MAHAIQQQQQCHSLHLVNAGLMLRFATIGKRRIPLLIPETARSRLQRAASMHAVLSSSTGIIIPMRYNGTCTCTQ